MSELDGYLQKHYLSAEKFAALCGLSAERLDQLIQSGLVPAPSYVVTSASTVKSSVFGEMDAPGSIAGSYFHPKGKVWVELALSEQNATALKNRFAQNFISALTDLNTSTWRLVDSFTKAAEPIPAGLSFRVEEAWGHLLRGTFGLCISDPSSELSIATKEVLQEKLSAMTSNGTEVPDDRIAQEELKELIDQYASAAMPFSPIEYPRSSRKRLVDDLRSRLAKV